jgi:hypothetical protein
MSQENRNNSVPRGNPHSDLFNSLLASKAIQSKYKNVITSIQPPINFCGLGRTTGIEDPHREIINTTLSKAEIRNSQFY